MIKSNRLEQQFFLSESSAMQTILSICAENFKIH